MNDTPKGIFAPQKTAVQRLAVFTKQLASVGATPEFFLNKAFDYALSLPEVYKLKSQTERLEASVALLREVAVMHTEEAREQEEELTKRHDGIPHSQQEEQEEAVATG